MNSPYKLAFYTACVFMAVGLLPLPYAYYMLLRVLICGVSVYAAVLLKPRHQTYFWIAIGLAVLYNPVIPVYLYSKALWVVINLGTLWFFWQVKEELEKGRSNLADDSESVP